MISLFLKDVAEKRNLHVKDDVSLKTLIELMNKNQQGVIVLLDGNKPTGILTERDIAEIVFNGVSLDDMAGKYAHKEVITTRGDRSIGYGLNLMIENNIRRIVVISKKGDFVGVVTQKNMLRHLEEDFYRATIRVKHILERSINLISVKPEEPIYEALRKIVQNKISAVPVIHNKKAVGVITEKDIIELARKNVSLKSEVNKFIIRQAVTVSLDTTLVDVVKTMNNNNIRRVVVEDSKGAVVGMITLRDVLKNLEGGYSDFLEMKLKYTKEILNLLPEMLLEVSDTGKEHLIIWANEKFLNKHSRKVIDRPITSFIPVKTWEKIYNNLLRSSKIEEVRFKKGKDVYEVSGFFIKTDGKLEKGRIHLIARDITDDIRLLTTDTLTGIYNRRFINEFLINEIERSKRMNKRFSIAMLDIDDFKKLNDTYGHMAGDAVLKFMSNLIAESLRKSDIVGRYGGEEFIIIMPETDMKVSGLVSERVRKKIEDGAIPLSKKKSVNITASFGIASFPDDGISSDDLLITADDRLYKAKKEGKNKVCSE